MTVRIGLDAGHGLKTSGKQTPNGVKEWTLNDKVRDKIVHYLKDYDCTFIFTDNDEGNTDESLSYRLRKYKGLVDVFVSCHHNAYNGKWNNVTGVEVYVDKNATAKDLQLAKCIYENLPAYTGLKGRGIKKANFTIIYQNTTPAVLVEGGFMDSNIDYPVINSEIGQNGYARAVAEGLIKFLGLKKKQVAPANIVAHVKVTANSLNIRAGASTKYKVVATAKRGGEYDVYEIKNGWGRINGGWISLEYTTYSPEPAPLSKTVLYKVKINTASLNVRTGAGTSYKAVTTVKKNEVYSIVEEKNGWGRLKSNVGWIKLSYTKKV